MLDVTDAKLNIDSKRGDLQDFRGIADEPIYLKAPPKSKKRRRIAHKSKKYREDEYIQGNQDDDTSRAEPGMNFMTKINKPILTTELRRKDDTQTKTYTVHTTNLFK
jgi:hypothetical protein